VTYEDAHALQRALCGSGHDEDWLLLLEHPPVYTLGTRASLDHVLVDPTAVGATLVESDRGGDVTYHGPGQLVGYPILSLASRPGVVGDYVRSLEQLLIDALTDVGLPGADRLPGYPGVWLGVDDGTPRKVAAIGARFARGRTMHGFALNVQTDLAMFGHIVPCGIADKEVTSLRAEGCAATMQNVVDAVIARASTQWVRVVERQDVAWRVRPGDLAAFTRDAGHDGAPVRLLGRLAEAGVAGRAASSIGRKPPWLRVRVAEDRQFDAVSDTVRDLGLVTVCEEAGCPNLHECWSDGTATFMINGERCTRACGFCLVDTRRPAPLDPGEPDRVAAAVARMELAHAVVTTVARDDLADGGASGFVATIKAIRDRNPHTAIEVLISDCRGDTGALQQVFDARPDVLAHNVETVPRLQRAVRPSASYTRSLAVLARASAARLRTKTSVLLGMGEREDEVLGVMADIRGVGVDVLTLGQYLRPSRRHLPVDRWWSPEEFDRLAAAGLAMGFAHVEASPLTRSSYHARQAAAAKQPV
jgi:lipoic acid synthetase